MAGYIHDPLQIINLIADNLRDRYKSGFPVLKEIIQNADDAGSADENIGLEFGLSPGIPAAQHPLLQGPALYFLNNGHFTESDNRAIRSFGLNRKAVEQSSIGKFGLGMKSVFHFCEAFFFLAKNQEKEYAQILNPWSGNEEFVSHHTDWDHFSSTDGELIKAHLRSVMDAMDMKRGTFFLLWLPLRKREHLRTHSGKAVGSIINEFPGDTPELLAFLHEANLTQRIASLMPLLRRINQIRFWDGSTTPVFEVTLDSRSQRISRDLAQARTGREMVGAAIYTRREQQKSFTSYCGLEMLVETPELLTLKQSSLWPKTYVRNEYGESEEAPDKAQGHCAAVFSSSDEKGSGSFIINWAVFLPIGEKRNETKACGGDRTFRLTLHGYFFVDAGRADIEGLQEERGLVGVAANPANEAELRSLWNSRLARQGTLPLVLPALAGFVAKSRLSADDRWHLSQGLAESQTFKQYRKVICAQHSWVCRLTSKGKEWGLVSSDQVMRTLPEPPVTIPDRPWATFPKLELFESRDIALLLKRASPKVTPHLLAAPLPQWNETDLLELLQIDEITVFTDRGRLDYLLAFLTDDTVRPFLNVEDLQRRLQEIFKRAFGTLGTGLSQHQSKVQEFVSLLQPEIRYPIKQDAPEVIQGLQHSISSVLILSAEFDAPKTPGTAQLSIDDAFVLLQKLHDLIVHHDQIDDDKTEDFCREIAGDILQKQPEEQRRILLARAGKLKILAGYDCTRKKVVTLSASEIHLRHSGNLLFQYSQGINLTQQLGLAPKLQAAVKESVIVIKRGVIDLVFDKNTRIPSCNAEGVLDALGKNALTLQPMPKRRPLLQDTAGTDLSSPGRIRGLRYLLHGLAEHFEDMATLWVSGYEESAVWGKIWKHLQKDVPNQWTLIDRKLVEEIASNKWASLKIQEIKPKGILEEIRQVGTEKLTGIDLSREERNTVLRELVNDEELWKLLPFHETVQGKFVRIVPGKTFLGAASSLPGELLHRIDLIPPSGDKLIQRSQSEWIEPLNSESAIRIVLRQSEPAKFWSLVLGHLDKALQNHEQNDFIEDLVETAWLLDNNHMPVRPSDVIHLESLEDEVNRLLAQTRGAYSSPSNLLIDIQSHSNFSFLKQHCFASNKQGFEKLALLLGETAGYRIGSLRLPDNRDQLDKMVSVCCHFPSGLRLPGWELLAKSLQGYPEHLAKDILLPELLRPIALSKIIEILGWLQREHESAPKDTRQETLAIFNVYLEALVNQEGEGLDLSSLKLLNGEGRWMEARFLCAEAEGVAERHLLDKEQQRVLSNVVVYADRPSKNIQEGFPKRRDLQPEITASVGILRDFFGEWKEIVPEELICAFLALLGDDPGMLALAEEFRGRHTIDWIRGQFPWQVHHRIDSAGRQEWMFGIDKQQAFAMHRFVVQCSEGDTVDVASILGERISVPLKSEFTSLISGGLYYEPQEGERITIRIGLRKPDIQHITPAELSGYLRSSAEYLLSRAYNQKNIHLGGLWDELDKSEQIDIRVAQQLILENIPFYLRQLGAHKHHHLREIIKKFDDARHRKAEFADSREKKEHYEKKERQHLYEIQNLLTSDQEIQKVVLNAVRLKMGDFQYTTASIPFELFQNADDAVVELITMQCYPDLPQDDDEELLTGYARRFILQQQAETLTFIHWGRRVNEVGGGGFPGREKGFHQDLEKMIMLSASDKSEEGKVTGKFGLGFKSVLLASDKPKLVSGRLATEIIAGLCPVPLQDAHPYRQKILELAPGEKRRGTLIELPLMDALPEKITADFIRLAGPLTIFSKQIRRIDIEGLENRTWRWQPEKIACAHPAVLELGELVLSGRLGSKQLALHFRFSEGGILVGIGPKGFRPLPAELPAIWVVAPTRETQGLGFAINGPFDLDAGRSRLAGNSVINKQKASDLGRVYGRSLVQLSSSIRENWPSVREQLRLEGDLTEYTFWQSLWEVFNKGLAQKGSEEVSELVAHILSEENGLGYLLNHEDAMPNGLWGPFQRRTKPDRIRSILKGGLAEEEFFLKICSWDFFHNYLGDPETILAEQIFRQAKSVVLAFGQSTTQYRFVGLFDVIHAFIKQEKEITPQTAAILGAFLNDFVKSELFEKEREQIKTALKDFNFLAEDGTFRKSNELLIAGRNSLPNFDEGKRAAFAPERSVLSAEYQQDGQDFFLLCRDKIDLPVVDMAEWIRDATTIEKQGSGLRYLLNGEYGEKVAKELRKINLSLTWLAELGQNSPCFSEWEQEDIDEILYRKLRSIEELRYQFTEYSNESLTDLEKCLRGKNPKEVLEKIHTWWLNEKEVSLQEYENKTYPETISIDFSDDDVGRIDRSSWLVIFLLAHLHTMGRQRDTQHKGFIDRCVQRGWWDTFTKPNPEKRSDEWMGVLEGYIDRQMDASEYEQWMNRFPVIYKFSRWLDVYQGVFLSLDQQQEVSNIAGLLKTRVNPQFQGGGYDAPPIERSLGHGACFVVRELRRKKVLTKLQVDPFCFVPVERVRNFCTLLGCNGINDQAVLDHSKMIYDFLCMNLGKDRADFDGCYDIPLQILTEKDNLGVLRAILN